MKSEAEKILDWIPAADASCTDFDEPVYEKSSVLKAMEQYKSLHPSPPADTVQGYSPADFAEWILKEGILPRDTMWFDAGKHYSSCELFNLYKSQRPIPPPANGYTLQSVVNKMQSHHPAPQPERSAEEILEKYRLYVLPEVFEQTGKTEKVSWNGAIKAMHEFRSQYTPSTPAPLGTQGEDKAEPREKITKELYDFLTGPEKPFFVDQIRKQLNEYLKEEISFSKFVELLNEKLITGINPPPPSPSAEGMAEAIQNALYATGRFTTDDCETLADGILTYIKDTGFTAAPNK